MSFQMPETIPEVTEQFILKWLQAEGFTERELAKRAKLKLPTARELLNRSRSRHVSSPTLTKLRVLYEQVISENTAPNPGESVLLRLETSDQAIAADELTANNALDPTGAVTHSQVFDRINTGHSSVLVEEEDHRHSLSQEIFIPVHGFVWLSDCEMQIVNHPSFQRIRRINQLGMAQVVYPGATHTRFEHVLGVLHVTGEIVKSINENRERAKRTKRLDDPSESAKWANEISEGERRFIRLGALLHDIGHLPFGHSLEDELRILNKHDEEDRLTLVLNKNNWTVLNDTKLNDILEQNYVLEKMHLRSIDRPITPAEIVISIILHGPTRKLALEYAEALRSKDRNVPVKDETIRATFARDLAELNIRLDVCSDIVGNTICGDLLDYLHRDWHHVGKSKYLEDRVLHYMEVRSDPNDKSVSLPNQPRSSDRFVINLGRYPRLRTDAVSLILELLESRYNLAEAVLFHRTKLKLTAMLERCLAFTFEAPNWKNDEWDKGLESQLLSISEGGFLDELCEFEPKFMSRKLSNVDKVQRQRLAHCIRERSLFRHVHTIPFSEGRPEAVLRFQHIYASHQEAPLHREACLKQIESDFNLNPGELVMYCPQTSMNAKIAQVRIVITGEIHRLDEFEQKSGDSLAAGHLAAQLQRFRKLWLVTFLVDPHVQNRFDFDDVQFAAWRRLLANYIQACVVGTSLGKNLIQEQAEVRSAMATSKEFMSSWGIDRQQPIVLAEEPELLAARSEESPTARRARRNGATGRFPSLAQSFWKYVAEDE